MNREDVYKEIEAMFPSHKKRIERAIFLYEFEKYRADLLDSFNKVSDVIREVCSELNISEDRIGSSTRREYSRARQIIWYLLDKKLVQNQLGPSEMGRMFDKSHATALSGIASIKESLEVDKGLRHELTYIAYRFNVVATWDEAAKELKLSNEETN
jgi:chromosomal replication initiation ATPase DnaA